MPMSLGIGAGVGLLKNQLGQGQQKKERMLAAQTAAYSPWTGMKAQNPAPDTSAFNDALQGGMAGAQFGQQFMPKPPMPPGAGG